MFSITTQRRVDPARQDTIIRLAETGNTEGVKIMLNKREAHPDDVDLYTGQTALYVCIGNGSSIKSFR